MEITIKDIKNGVGACGLVCALCKHYMSNSDGKDKKTCLGCASKIGCEIKACCEEKGITHCFLCPDMPCGHDTLTETRVRVPNETAKNEGPDKLAEYLYKNLRNGITYHRPDGVAGDYDRCKTEQELLDLLKNGKPDPFSTCPVYESKSFLLRLVSPDDADDLLRCYVNKEARRFFNADTCTSDFFYESLDEMRSCIGFWLEEYKAGKFVRFSIIVKASGKAVGTVEIIGSSFSVLRADILPEYESEEHLSELLNIADSFFHDFGCHEIVTKAIPEAEARISALIKNGYGPFPQNKDWDREHYYRKEAME